MIEIEIERELERERAIEMKTNAANFPPLISWIKRRTRQLANAMIETDHENNQEAVKYHPTSSITSWVETSPVETNISHVTSRNDHQSSTIHEIHLSAGLMDEFMVLASANTDNDLETCGILGASLKNGIFYVTTLIVPKQESSSNSCLAMCEDEIFALQDELSLFPLGWIHTHPSQSCFMSSVDLHTQYSYQVMLPEAVAIVMAPTDSSRNFGIFRLTDPEGIKAIRECKEGGFHLHREPTNGSQIYEECSNVYINPNLRFEVIDLR